MYEFGKKWLGFRCDDKITLIFYLEAFVTTSSGSETVAHIVERFRVMDLGKDISNSKTKTKGLYF